MRTTRLGATFLAAMVVAVAGCGGDGEPAAGTATTAPTSTAAPEATTTTAVATSTTAGSDDVEGEGAETFGELVDDLAGTEEGQTELEQLALELLVVPGDFAGQTYADNGYTPFEGPNRCGTDVDAAHPPSVLVGTALLDDDDRAIHEEIRVYADAEAAAVAYEAHRVALDCGAVAGEVPGDGVVFGTPVDVNAEVGADAASEITAELEEHRTGVIITALVGDAIVEVDVSQPDAAERTLVDREVAAFAVGKVLAALESASAAD